MTHPAPDLLERIPCPLCGRRHGRQAFRLKERLAYNGLPDDIEYTVSECDGCGLLFVNPRLRERVITAIYAGDLYASYGEDRDYVPKITLRHDIFHDKIEERLAAYAHFCDVLERMGVSGKALDVGCSFGYLMDALRGRGFDVAGVELSRQTCEFAARHFGFADVRQGDFLAIDFAPASFDLIVLWHVFEHVYRPNETLAKCAKLLRPGGHLMLTCPFHKVFEEKNINPVEHLYYFQPSHLQRFMEKHMDCQTWMDSGYVFGKKAG